MGYDIARFRDAVHAEFICAICKGVLENAVLTPDCEHAFCETCIVGFLSTRGVCPVDNSNLQVEELCLLPRIFKNLLGELMISCSFSNCTAYIRLDKLDDHVKECQFNPVRGVPCAPNCGGMVGVNENAQMNESDSVAELRRSLDGLRNDHRRMNERYEHKFNTYLHGIQNVNRIVKVEKLQSKFNKKIIEQLFAHKQQMAQLLYVQKVSNKYWWKKLDLIIGKLYSPLVSQGSLMSNFGVFLKLYGCPVQEWHSFELCKCANGDDHNCGIEGLRDMQLSFRWSSSLNIWLILKEENPQIPAALIPQSGFALYFKND